MTGKTASIPLPAGPIRKLNVSTAPTSKATIPARIMKSYRVRFVGGMLAVTLDDEEAKYEDTEIENKCGPRRPVNRSEYQSSSEPHRQSERYADPYSMSLRE